jgi:predicted O-methyltransferase YrrM
MSLLKVAALCVPAIRRLYEERNRMITELQAAHRLLAEITEHSHLANEPGAAFTSSRGVNRASTGSRGRQETVDVHDDTPQLHLTELLSLRAAHRQLEEETSAIRLAKEQNRLFITEYAYVPARRPMDQGAGGRAIEDIFYRNIRSISNTIRGIARHTASLAQIPRDAQHGSSSPFWANSWFPPFDGASLYGLVAEMQPRRYIEVGSGISTRFARQAITDLHLKTRIISIDPHPHNKIDELCDQIITRRAEDMPNSFWEELDSNDIVFIDNSHRCFPGSDVTVFFTEVLPSLAEGIIYGIHDIFLPNDYPEEWNGRFYSEQYLLMMYLLGGGGHDEILLPVNWAGRQPELHGLLSELWNCTELFRGLGTGGAFWARRGKRQEPVSNLVRNGRDGAAGA